MVNLVREISAMDNLSTQIVISNKRDAAGIGLAQELGVKTAVIPSKNNPNFEKDLLFRLKDAGVDIICLAGFMKILSTDFIAHYPGRILNIHPSLLPKYPGLNTHQRAIDAGDEYGGATVHIVTEDLDCGPIIDAERVKILPDDNADSLAQRVLQVEHTLYPRALRKFAAGLG